MIAITKIYLTSLLALQWEKYLPKTNSFSRELHPFQSIVVFQIEINYLICSAKKMTGFYMIFNITQNRQPKFYLIHLLFLLVTQSPVGIYLLKATNNDIRVQHPLMLLLFLIVDSEKIFVEILVRFPFVCPVCINKFHNCCQIS